VVPINVLHLLLAICDCYFASDPRKAAISKQIINCKCLKV